MVQHEFDESQSASLAVINAVSAVAGRKPTELPPLYDAINPDALDSLFETQNGENSANPRVSFDYDEFSVVVARSGPQLAVEVEQQ